jgi:hypothetical protein
MNVTEEQTIWYPGIYGGRQGDYAKKVAECDIDEIVRLVQIRAQEDGQWAIDNDHVGDNEDNMRRMMKFVADGKNIKQCVEHIYKEGVEQERTVDFVCRDLANASKYIHGTHA